MTTTMSTTREGREEAGHRGVVVAPSSFKAAGAVANICDAVVAIGNDDSFHPPQRSADIARQVFQYLLIGMYSFVEWQG
jgi:hypothetical protein